MKDIVRHVIETPNSVFEKLEVAADREAYEYATRQQARQDVMHTFCKTFRLGLTTVD